MRPVRVDYERAVQAVGIAPEQREPVPRGVVGEVVEQPLLALADRAVVLGDRHHPLRRALVDRQVARRLRDRRGSLHRARARADERHALALQVEAVRPARRVEQGARERVEAFDRRQLGTVDVADSGDDHAAVDLVDAPAGVGERRAPALGALVVARAQDARVAANPVADATGVENLVDVRQDLRLLGEVGRPRPACAV
jgi:hypothetical protein